VFAKKSVGQVADHLAGVIGKLKKKPAVIGHSFGGLFTQIMAGRALSAASVAVDPAPFRGVLPLPFSVLKAAFPVLGNPANRNRAVRLTFEQFRFGFANAVSEDEARELHKTFHVPAAGLPLFQAAFANLNPWAETKGRHQKSRPRPAADHLRREGPHRPVGDRQRVFQEAEAQPGRDGNRGVTQPRALAGHRQRLARGCRQSTGVREALHVASSQRF
jgi:pimeloyl-ACP methyl ester carboxylesterase